MFHSTAFIDPGAIIGEGTVIWHFCHVMKDSIIGKNCSLGQNVVMMTGASLGDHVKVQNNVSIYTGVHCEDEVFLGPSAIAPESSGISAIYLASVSLQ